MKHVIALLCSALLLAAFVLPALASTGPSKEKIMIAKSTTQTANMTARSPETTTQAASVLANDTGAPISKDGVVSQASSSMTSFGKESAIIAKMQGSGTANMTQAPAETMRTSFTTCMKGSIMTGTASAGSTGMTTVAVQGVLPATDIAVGSQSVTVKTSGPVAA